MKELGIALLYFLSLTGLIFLMDFIYGNNSFQDHFHHAINPFSVMQLPELLVLIVSILLYVIYLIKQAKNRKQKTNQEKSANNNSSKQNNPSSNQQQSQSQN